MKMIRHLFAIFAVHENKYFSQHNSRNTHDASKSDRQYCTAQKYFRHNNWRNTHDTSESDRQYCTAQKYFRHNNWQNTRDASESDRQYCTAQKYFSQHNSRNTLEASNPTGNTVPLKNILGTNTPHWCTFQKSLLMSLVLLVNLFVMSPQTCKLFIHFVAR